MFNPLWQPQQFCPRSKLRETLIQHATISSSSHAPVVSAGYPSGQSRVGTFRPPGADLYPNAAIGLASEQNRHLLRVSAAPDDSALPIFRDDPHPFVLSRRQRRAPSAIERARHGRRDRLAGSASCQRRQTNHQEQGHPYSLPFDRYAEAFDIHIFASFLSRASRINRRISRVAVQCQSGRLLQPEKDFSLGTKRQQNRRFVITKEVRDLGLTAPLQSAESGARVRDGKIVRDRCGQRLVNCNNNLASGSRSPSTWLRATGEANSVRAELCRTMNGQRESAVTVH